MLKLKQWDQLFCQNNTPLQKLEMINGIEILVKRDDLNHDIVQGNKLRKLKYNLKFAIENKFSTLATFGGAYSNHILAVAQAAQLCGLKSVGFIRGDELAEQQENWSQTLKQAHIFGMQFIFLNRKEYRIKQEAMPVKNFLKTRQEKTYLIPEGGSNALAIKGAMETIKELQQQHATPTHIICACGTGGTLAGLIDGVAQTDWKTNTIGIPVLKGAEFLKADIQKFSQNHVDVNWNLCHDYHAGGYAKINQETLDFGIAFTKNTGIPLDKIYNIKTFYAAYDLIKQGLIKPKSSVIIIHTGGLQGGLI